MTSIHAITTARSQVSSGTPASLALSPAPSTSLASPIISGPPTSQYPHSHQCRPLSSVTWTPATDHPITSPLLSQNEPPKMQTVPCHFPFMVLVASGGSQGHAEALMHTGFPVPAPSSLALTVHPADPKIESSPSPSGSGTH